MTELEIEQIVQSVLKQIQPVAAGASVPQSKTVVEKPAGGVRLVSGRIITADLLAAEVQPGELIAIEARALITPAARDYLKEKKIVISSAASSIAAGQKSVAGTGNRWLGLTVDTSAALHTALKTVQQQKLAMVDLQISSSTEEAAQTAISEFHRGSQQWILIFTKRTATAACLANRHEMVRAVAVTKLQDQELIEELQANVICLSTQGMSVADYLQLLRGVLKQK